LPYNLPILPIALFDVDVLPTQLFDYMGNFCEGIVSFIMGALTMNE